MIPYFNRGIPKNYPKPKSTQDRAFIKKLSLFDWIARFGYTSPCVVTELWDVDVSVVNRALKNYTNEGYLTQVPVNCCRDKRVYLLKPKAVALINAYHLTNVKYNTKKSNLPLKVLNHDLMVQFYLSIQINSGKFGYFITEKEQEKDNVGIRRRVDAIAFDTTLGEMVAVEVEGSCKVIPHRIDILKKYQRAMLEEKLYTRVLFVSAKRRYVRDCERIHEKVFAKPGHGFNDIELRPRLKYIYNKEVMALLYHKIWEF